MAAVGDAKHVTGMAPAEFVRTTDIRNAIAKGSGRVSSYSVSFMVSL